VLAVVGDQFVEWHVPERDQTRGGFSAADAAIPDVAVADDPEPRLAIVLLLGHDPVEPHVPLAEMAHPGSPYLEAVPPPPESGSDNVMPDETERIVIGHARNTRDGFSVQFPEEEPLGIGPVETLDVV
jgi:hypothetical protein